MSVVYSPLFSPKLILPSPVKPSANPASSSHSYFPSVQCNSKKRDSPVPAVASFTYPPVQVDYLESEFSGHGVTFEDINDNCVVKMRLDNGSSASLMLPSGLITSYKAPMWHGGTLELLHTCVSEGEDGGAVIQGGVSLDFNCLTDGISWSPTTWVLRDVRGHPREHIQVELVSCNSADTVEVRHILTLRHDLLSSELVISNAKSSSLRLTGSVLSHLTVSTPEATYAVGLEGSNFQNRPPFLSSFAIVLPDSGQGNDLGSAKLWSPAAIKELWSSWGARNQNNDYDASIEGEERDNYKHLTDELSRIYTCAPRNFTLIDRGRRNSIEVGRDGFDELYIFSPGSRYKWYGKYAYVCVGPSALLEPIILSPQSKWRGLQQLHNPNL